MVTFNIRTALLIPVLVTFAHMLFHEILNPFVSGVLNPLLISFGVYFAYRLVRNFLRPMGRRLSKRQEREEMRRGTIYCWIVAGLHFVAHLVSSSLSGLPIIDNTVVGIAGSVVFLSVFVFEVFF